MTSTEQPGRPDASPDNRPGSLWREVFRNRGFVACLALLVTLAVSFEVLAIWKGVLFRKEPIPLKKPLGALQHAKLEPYGFERQLDLPPESVNQLGTEDYIQWVIDDPFRPDGTREDVAEEPTWLTPRWRRQMNLFVTYYTGRPDQVPHIPEVCYAGSGHQEVGNALIDLAVPALGPDVTIPVVILEFRREGMHGTSRRVVMYTFHANGQFRKSRNAVRLAVGDPRCKHAYFSKLEINMDIGMGYATETEAIEAGKRFLQVVAPVLVEDHWPDWQAAVSQSESAAPADTATRARPADG